ncbi:MAG TPA: hypothetical protein VHG69_07070, partial [Thermoleophilaceae bacterium]|nr:hypothetical protein [Thermoleophilaceae bacterium]
HTFAPDPGRAAAELLRVCRPGGAIAVSGWTDSGVGAHLKRLAGVDPVWGSEERVRELLGDVTAVEFEKRSVTFDADPEDWSEFVARSIEAFLQGREDGLREQLRGLEPRQEYAVAVVRL